MQRVLSLLFLLPFITMAQTQNFNWPEGKQMGLSLSWDDARDSQVTVGTAILDNFDIKATFYVLPSGVERQLSGWKKAVASGHEIANHSLNHPCSGNFLWARANALEGYSLQQMESELLKANSELNRLLGVKVNHFAYPCGQTFVNRGENTQSYVPVIARNFVSGRTWLDEAPNDPAFVDLAQVTGVEMDGKNFEEIKALIDTAKKDGLWLVLAGHEINIEGEQTTQTEALTKLLRYLKTDNSIWVAPVGSIAEYIQGTRAK
ncbi:MAG: polysaccharide deacetylase family protein [Cytophagales bacterium]|nr:polysaccharide deacetylase family protein [Cytophagales bacterium]